MRELSFPLKHGVNLHPRLSCLGCVFQEGLSPEEKDELVQSMALKMLSEFTLMYSPCVGVLLKRDAEGPRGRGSSPPVTPVAKAEAQGGNTLFRHAATPSLYLEA